MSVLDEVEISDAVERSLRPGEIVFREGDVPRHLHQVLSGCIKITRCSKDGRDVITELLFPGDYFDVASVLEGSEYCVRASSLSGQEARILSIARAALMNCPQVLAQAQRQCLSQMCRQREVLAALATERVDQRILMVLQMLAERTIQRSDGFVEIPVPLSRQEYADLIGSSTETAIRVLSDFRRRGEIAQRGKRLFWRPQVGHDQLPLVIS